MLASPIYWGVVPYRLTMRLLYGRSYVERYRLVSGILPDGSSVIELCCGCGFLYEKFLAPRSIEYIGVDMLGAMLKRLNRLGITTIRGDALKVNLEKSEYCIMLGSLYHFLPNAHYMLQHMVTLGSTGIILEPIKNISNSKYKFISHLSKALSYIQNTSSSERFSTDMLDDILEQSGVKVLSNDLVLSEQYRLVIFTA